MKTADGGGRTRVVAWAMALTAVATAACRDGSTPAANEPPDAPQAPSPTDGPPTGRPGAVSRQAPEGPRAPTRWAIVLADDAKSIELAAAPDGAVVAVTRGPSEGGAGPIAIHRVDRAGAVAWRLSYAPACDVSVSPLGASPGGEVFLAVRAHTCDDPLPGVWPAPLRPGAIVVLGEAGGFRRSVVADLWGLARLDALGDVWAAEDRQTGGGLTLRKRAPDGTVRWERSEFMGTKAPLDLAVAPGGGAYALRAGALTRLRTDGTSAWSRPNPARGWRVPRVSALDGGAAAVVADGSAGTRWGSGVAEHDGTAVFVTEADGAPRTVRSVPGDSWHRPLALPRGGVGLVTRDAAYGPGAAACWWIEALGASLQTRWARRVEEGCDPSVRILDGVADPAGGTIALGGLFTARGDLGDGKVVEPRTGATAAVLASIDASASAADEPPPPPSRLDASWDVPATGAGATRWARTVEGLASLADAGDGTALVTSSAPTAAFTLSRVDASGRAAWTRSFDAGDCWVNGAVRGVTADGGIVLSVASSCSHPVSGLGPVPPDGVVLLDRDGAFVRRVTSPTSARGERLGEWVVDADGALVVKEISDPVVPVLSKRDQDGALLWSIQLPGVPPHASMVAARDGGVVVVATDAILRVDGAGSVLWRTPLGDAPALPSAFAAAVLRDGAVAVAGHVSAAVSFGAGRVPAPGAGATYVAWILEPDGRPRAVVPLGMGVDAFRAPAPLHDGGFALVGDWGCSRVQALSATGEPRWDRPVDRNCQAGVHGVAGIEGALLLQAWSYGSLDLGSGVRVEAPALGARPDVLIAVEP